MLRLLILLAALTFCSSGQALEKLEFSDFENMFFHAVTSLESEMAGASPQVCPGDYEDLYSQSQVNVSIFGGYADDDNHQVTDRASVVALTRILQRDCRRDRSSLCGFHKVGSNDLKLSKDTLIQGRRVRVLIDLYFSSLSVSDERNQSSRQQEWHSKQVRSRFVEALQTADVVLYDGHARDGGGPDFFPPKRYGNGHVNYGWYHRRRPGVKDMTSALKRRQKELFLFGFYACYTQAHFYRRLRPLSGEAYLGLTSRLVNEFETYEALVRTLEALLSQRCLADFRRELRTLGATLRQ